MEDGYWGLFWQTGMPEFYLMKKKDEDGGEEEREQRTRDAVQPPYG